MSRQMWLVGLGVVVVLSVATPLTISAISSPPKLSEQAASSPTLAPAPVVTSAPASQLPVGVSTEGSTTYYTVQPFDIGKREGTLTYIAQRFNTTVAQLVAWNHIKNPNQIDVGQKLRVR